MIAKYQCGNDNKIFLEIVYQLPYYRVRTSEALPQLTYLSSLSILSTYNPDTQSKAVPPPVVNRRG